MRPRRPYTVDTLSRMQAELGDEAQLFFIMGADSWMEITTWREWERVLELTNHIVVTRPGYELSAEHVTPAVASGSSTCAVLASEEVAREIDEKRRHEDLCDGRGEDGRFGDSDSSALCAKGARANWRATGSAAGRGLH